MDKKDLINQENMQKYYDESYYNVDSEKNYISKIFKSGNYSYKKIFQIYYPHKNEIILDVGCGWGGTSLTLQKDGFDVTGLDYSEKAIELCKKKATQLGLDSSKFICQDATDTKLKSNSFDVVYCCDLVEHIYPDIYLSLLNEVHRILKIDGKFIIYTPNPSHFFEILKNNNIILKKDITHVDYKTMKRLKKSLLDSGFDVIKAYYIESHIPIINIFEKMVMNFLPICRRRNAILAVKK